MPETTTERRIITSSSWWIWILLIIGILAIVLIVYGGWRLFRGATEVVQEEAPAVALPNRRSTLRFVRTPTEVVVIDDPVIPEGEMAIESIVENFEDYQGERVIVSGNVSDFENASFFQVVQDEDRIAVLSLPEAIMENQLEEASDPDTRFVRVTGTVKLLTREREKTEFGLNYRDLDEAFWQDSMIIEAERIEVINPSTT